MWMKSKSVAIQIKAFGQYFPMTIRPVARIFFFFWGGGREGGGCERGQSGPNYRNEFIDCPVSRLFQGTFRVIPTRKTRQGLQKSTPSG